MERDHNHIIFNEGEQKEFNVPPSIDIPIALETATALEDVANKLEGKSKNISDESDEDGSAHLSEVQKLQARAGRLRTFSNNIIEAAFSE